MKHKHSSLNTENEEEGGSYTPSDSFWEIVPSDLSTDEREVVRLRLEGYNFKEISESLDLNRSSIKKLFNNAVKKIRDNNAQ